MATVFRTPIYVPNPPYDPPWQWQPPRRPFVAQSLALGSGTYTYTGTAATFAYQPILAMLIASRRIWNEYVPPPDWVWSPPVRSVFRVVSLALGSGAYNYVGTAASFVYQPVLAALIASRRIWNDFVPQPDWQWQPPPVKSGVAYVISLVSGSYIYTGTAATFQRLINMSLGSGSYLYTGATDFTLTLKRAGQATVEWLIRARRRLRR